MEFLLFRLIEIMKEKKVLEEMKSWILIMIYKKGTRKDPIYRAISLQSRLNY